METLRIHEGMKPTKMSISKYPEHGTIPVTDQRLLLGEDQCRQIGEGMLAGLINFCPPGSKLEKTLAMRKTGDTGRMGLPTMIVRADCVVDAKGRVLFYEVEERPGGMGYSVQNGVFEASAVTDHLGELTGADTRVLVLPERKFVATDDGLIFDLISPDQLRGDKGVSGPLLCRLDPDEARLHMAEDYGITLLANSISTVGDKGKKDYRIAQGIAVVARKPDDLPPPNISFAVKPIQGKGSVGVKVYLSPMDKARLGIKKSHSYDAVLAELAARGRMLVEPFVEPMHTEINGKAGNLILRIFGLVGPDGVTVIGGMGVSRPELVVHGASNAAQTPVDVERHLFVPRVDSVLPGKKVLSNEERMAKIGARALRKSNLAPQI
jgi:hypothetical protein